MRACLSSCFPALLSFPAPASPEGVTMVEKPISEAQILQYLKPILKIKKVGDFLKA
jgi:hypothetical protein